MGELDLPKEKNKEFIELSLSELDSATQIISDFLTFAKPQLENMRLFHLADECKHVMKVITPFFSTKKGKGLGMMVAYSLIKAMNGSITVESEINMGSKFIIIFPIPPPKHESSKWKQFILIVELITVTPHVYLSCHLIGTTANSPS